MAVVASQFSSKSLAHGKDGVLSLAQTKGKPAASACSGCARSHAPPLPLHASLLAELSTACALAAVLRFWPASSIVPGRRPPFLASVHCRPLPAPLPRRRGQRAAHSGADRKGAAGAA
jgi:hypothetical protein